MRCMSESSRTLSLLKAFLVMVVGGLLVKLALDAQRQSLLVSARSVVADKGEYGGDLKFLKSFHVPPAVEGESNHYFDLWSPGALPALARTHGLTNNHALFVDSHGRAGFLWHGNGYGFFPRRNLVRESEEVPTYSAKDLATVLGPEYTARIHNIVLAGCNAEGRLRSREFRRHFVNATNITYMTPGKLAFKPMYYQAITLPSSEIRPLYGKLRTTASKRVESSINVTAFEGSEKLGAYVADLYLPKARKPFCTQQAGRELLQPVAPALTVSAKTGR